MTDTRQPSRFSEGFYLYDTPAYPGALTDDDMQVMRRMKSDVRIDNYSIWHYEAGLNETDAHSPAPIVKADDAERAIEARMTAPDTRTPLDTNTEFPAHLSRQDAPGDYEQWLFNQPEYRNANLEERAAFRALAEPFDVYEDTPAPGASGEPYEQYLARKAILPTVDQIRAEWNLPENVEASENSAFVNGAYHPIILDIAALLNENAALRERVVAMSNLLLRWSGLWIDIREAQGTDVNIEGGICYDESNRLVTTALAGKDGE